MSPTSLTLTQFGRALCERQTSTSERALMVMLHTQVHCNREGSSVLALKYTIAVAAMIEVVDVAIAGLCSLMVFGIVGSVAIVGSCLFVVVVVVVESCLFVVVGVVVVVFVVVCLIVVADRCLFVVLKTLQFSCAIVVVVLERPLLHWKAVAHE
jgi:hypothetical protein